MGEAAQHVENAQPHPRNDAGVNRSARVKPANLIYSVDEVPPLPLTIVLGLQHVFVMSVGWIFVVVVATSIGASALETQTLIRMSMIASGLATILQAQTKGPIGSGYLCPFSCGPAYVSASHSCGTGWRTPVALGHDDVFGDFRGVAVEGDEALAESLSAGSDWTGCGACRDRVDWDWCSSISGL